MRFALRFEHETDPASINFTAGREFSEDDWSTPMTPAPPQRRRRAVEASQVPADGRPLEICDPTKTRSRLT